MISVVKVLVSGGGLILDEGSGKPMLRSDGIYLMVPHDGTYCVMTMSLFGAICARLDVDPTTVLEQFNGKQVT